MTLAKFIKTWQGKLVRDGQCVALYRQYIQDVWKIPALEGLGNNGGAEGLISRHYTDVGPTSRKFLEVIDRCAKPKAGDVAVFGATATNKFGHVGVVVKVIDEKKIQLFDADGLSKDKLARLSTWDRNRVIGYLRPRKVPA